MKAKNLDKYKPLIYKKALLIHKISGVQFDDICQDAYVIALQSILSFRPKKGATYLTYLYIRLDRKLLKRAIKERKFFKRHVFDEKSQELIEGQMCEDKGFERVDFADFLLTKLSKRSIELIGLVLDPMTEFVETESSKKYKNEKWKDKLTKEAIKKYLAKKGWRKCEITKSFSEIKNILSEWRKTDNDV